MLSQTRHLAFLLNEILFNDIIRSFLFLLYRDVKTSKDTSKPNLRGRGRGARTGNDRTNANTSKPRNNVISSVGLFSQGAGDGVTKQLYRSFRGAHDEGATASQLRRPTISAKREKIDPIAEKKKIAEIYDLDEDFDENNETEAVQEEGFAPIILTERMYSRQAASSW